MRLLFLEIDTGQKWATASVGPAFIASYIRVHGHEADFLRVPPNMEANEIEDEIAAKSPDLIGISLTNRQWKRAEKIAGIVGESLEIPIIAGGVFPCFESDLILSTGKFDYLCIGEGEYAVLDLLEALSKGEIIKDGSIKNIRIRGGELPGLRPPVEDLDGLPFLARDFLDEENGVRHMIVGRGCPFSCTYCSAGAMAGLYPGSAFSRRRSPANVIEEACLIKSEGDLNYVIFLDDTFPIDSGWFGEFCEGWKNKVGAGFSIHARLDLMDEEKIRALARSGCRHVVYGVESGSDRVRRLILNRKMENDEIFRVFRKTMDAGMLATANYMLGFPGETKDDIEKTLALNERIEPDDFGFFVFYPYPGTFLFRLCREKGYLPENYTDLSVGDDRSILNLPDLTKDEISHFFNRFTEARAENYLRKYGAPFNEEEKQMIRNQMKNNSGKE